MSLFQSSIPREEFQYDYHFVVEDKNYEYKVLKNFIITNCEGSNVQGQYVSSMSYQSIHSIHKPLKYFIIVQDKNIHNKRNLQIMLDYNFDNIYNKCFQVYEFNITPDMIHKEFENLKYHIHDSKTGHTMTYINVYSTNNKCRLNLNLFMTIETMENECVIVNGPSFEIK